MWEKDFVGVSNLPFSNFSQLQSNNSGAGVGGGGGGGGGGSYPTARLFHKFLPKYIFRNRMEKMK